MGDKSRQMDIEGVQEKEPFPPPQAFPNTTAAAFSDFPSPSSPLFSPQDPTVDLRQPKAKRTKMGASHTSGDTPVAFASPSVGSGAHEVSGRAPTTSGGSNHHTTNVASPRGEKRGTPDDTSGGVSGAHGEGKVPRRVRPISDPHAVGSTMLPGSSKDKASASPPPTRSSRSRFSVPAPNGITPIMTSAEPPQAGSSALPLQTPNRPSSSILDHFPEPKRLSLASDRPAPASPGSSSRRQSAMPEPPRGLPGFTPNVIPPTPTTAVPSLEKLNTAALRRSADYVLLKIQDFGYAENDPRRQYDLTINLHDPPRPPSPAPPGFIPPMNMDDTEESEASSNFGYIGGQTSRADEGGGGWLSKDSSNAEDYDDQQSSQFDLGPIEFTPGVYRALYPFEPEGPAEMALKEDQEVKCLGRSGDDGWLVVVKEVTGTGEVIHALVPESYMQLIRPLDNNEMEEAMG